MIRLIANQNNKPTIKWIEFYALDNGKVKHRYYTGNSFSVKVYSKQESAKIFNNFMNDDCYDYDFDDSVIPGPGL